MTDSRPDRELPKVVLVGFNKCGTRSFTRLFERAGHKAVHHKIRKPWRLRHNVAHMMRNNLAAGRKVFAGLEAYTFYSDLVYQTRRESFEGFRHFREILRDYPGTILVLNTRDREDWIRSRMRHGHGEFATRVMHERGINSLEALAEAWRRDWDVHVADVRQHMADYPEQLVEFNLDTDPVHRLVHRLAAYGLRAEDWDDVGRSRDVERHPAVAQVKRLWSYIRWRASA